MGKSHNIVLIRDAHVVAAALRQALDGASAETRPGLERAVTIVESTAAATETQVRGHWVRSRLADVGFSGDLTSVAAVKALRGAEPGLSLLAAVRLRDDAVAHPE
ncbi:hypothetical protein JK364_03215 [Streptomyces sp. 110]|uniref:Uncharacterized protein n=1 Tax=Streptomyces endocoffeicus TaxID=2898945 RepID=A0ABS1PGB1_9ACTN|nr:hypothetical protein [Streptomyces endocoffeicus]MBL1111423.1 hypothetical protein [Streptomyces endocoffeicus]